MTAEELDVYEKSLDAEYIELNKKRNDLSKRVNYPRSKDRWA